MTSSESEEQPPRRKRSRTSANSDDTGNKKARGRPRVDTQDATAADRRRTQIRLAQRAYRQRKETTISSLKAQNAHLQSIVEQMNKSFLRFNDSAMKSGLLQLKPTLAKDLQHVTETFVTLAKAATTEESNEGDDDIGDSSLDPAVEMYNATTSAVASRDVSQVPSRSPIPQHTDIGWGYNIVPTETSPLKNSVSLARDGRHTNDSFFRPRHAQEYEWSKQSSSLALVRAPLTVGGMLDPSSRSLSEESSNQKRLPFGFLDLMSPDDGQHHSNPIFSVNIPPITPEITPPLTRLTTPPLPPIPRNLSTFPRNLTTRSLNPPWTYSYDETTFARRLTRAALETGFHLLSNAQVRPAALAYVFKLSLPYMTLDELRNRFKEVLSRGTDEELDCWQTPFIHLGGAGTHYPRKDAHGNIQPIPNAWNVRSIGPMPNKRIRAENTEDPSKSHDLDIDLSGFEGEWFDAYDVQGYLEEAKGCHIDPRDSFAEVVIDADEEPAANNQSSLSFLPHTELNLDLTSTRRTAHSQSESPGFSSGTLSADSTSTKSTPSTLPGPGTSDTVFSQTEAFGLDMGVPNFHDLSKFSDVDVAAIFDQPLGLDLAPGFDTSMSSSVNTFAPTSYTDMSTLGLDFMGAAAALPVEKQRRKKTAWIDVSKLVSEIIKHGVCLGRAPGFRRKDVDVAYQASLIHAF